MSSTNSSTPSPTSSLFSRKTISDSCESFGESTPTRTLLDFQFLKRIGTGHSGQVFLAVDNRTGTLVAVKVVPKSKGLDKWILAEQDIQASLDDGQLTFLHPLLCSWHDTENYYLITEYLGGNDLGIELGVAGKFTEERVRFYAAEMVVALEQLRERNIIHRDIKPGNILFTREGHIRVTDFGLSKKFYPTTAQPPPPSHSCMPFEFVVDPHIDSGVFLAVDATQVSSLTTDESVGTPAYMTIEMHSGRPYSFEADIHALGVLMYRMLTQRLPFGETASTSEGVREAVMKDPLFFRVADNISDVARELVQRLLVKDPHDLMSLEQVKCHPYFYGVNWDRVSKQTLTPPWKPFIPPIPKPQETPPVKKGEDYEFSDPHPEFQFTSPRMDAPQEVPGAGENLLKKFGSFFDTMFDKNVMPPLTPSKTSPKAARKPQPAPDAPILNVITVPDLVMSTTPVDAIAPPLEVRTPTWPAGHSLPRPSALVFPIFHPSISTSRDMSQSEGVKPVLLAASLVSLRGRLPSVAIRRAIRSRPRGPDVPRPLRADISKIPEVTMKGSTARRARQVTARQPSSASKPAKVLASVATRKPTLVRRSPLRDVTNRSDLLESKSPAQAPRRTVPAGSPSASPKPKSKSPTVSPKPRPKPEEKSKPKPEGKLKDELKNEPEIPTRGPQIDLVGVDDDVFEPEVTEQVGTYVQPALAYVDATSKPTNLPRPNAENAVVQADFPSQAPEPMLSSDSPLAIAPSTYIHKVLPPLPSPPAAASSGDSPEDVAPPKRHRANATLGYPRAMERAQRYNYQDVGVKSKPAYPGANIEGKTRESWHLSVEKAFAIPPRAPTEARGSLRQLLLPDLLSARAASSSPARLPLMCEARLFRNYSGTLSEEARHRLYGRPSPPLRLTREELKLRMDDVVARARCGTLERARRGIFPSARCDDGFGTGSGPLLPGPHYAGSPPCSPPTGFLVYLRRYWVRSSLTFGRLLARAKAWLAPSSDFS